ncbi:unnamed protein product [Schistosoma curassoni]|uniref:Transposase n=1 Tax=Schistosoma curassoni TaxID=6186 RepID=A0A183JFN2_9TREM|nr:unnamed protein product [Schistosoma curassoni]
MQSILDEVGLMHHPKAYYDASFLSRSATSDSQFSG